MTNTKKMLAPDPGHSVNWLHVVVAALGFLVINSVYQLFGGVRLVLAVFLFAYLPTYFDGTEFTTKGRPWPALQKNRVLIRWFLGNIKCRLHVEPGYEPDSSRQAILAGWPHGVVSFMHVAVISDVGGFYSRKIYTHKRRDTGATVVFKIPLWRDINLALSSIDANKALCKRTLKEGYSLGILPGGEREQMLTKYQHHRVFMSTRKGFVKLAVEFGIDIIPYYGFGETNLYRTSDFLISFRKWVSKKFKIALPLPYNYFCGVPVPFLSPRDEHYIDVCFGRTIRAPKVSPKDSRFKETVDQVHKSVIHEVQRLFDSRKKELGYEDCELEIF